VASLVESGEKKVAKWRSWQPEGRLFRTQSALMMPPNAECGRDEEGGTFLTSATGDERKWRSGTWAFCWHH